MNIEEKYLLHLIFTKYANLIMVYVPFGVSDLSFKMFVATIPDNKL